MFRDQAITHLRRLENGTRRAGPEKLGIYADLVIRNGLTEDELQSGVLAVVETGSGMFPAFKDLLAACRPGRTGSPDETRADPKGERARERLSNDLDREEKALRAWRIEFTKRGDERQADGVQRRIEKLWDIREARGLTSALMREIAPGVEPLFGDPSPAFAGAAQVTQPEFGHWTENRDD